MAEDQVASTPLDASASRVATRRPDHSTFPAALPPSFWYGNDGDCGGYGGLNPERRHADENLVEQLHLDSAAIPKDPSGNPWAPM